MVKSGAQEGKPNCASTYLASVQVMSADIILNKTSSMAKSNIIGDLYSPMEVRW